MENKREGDLPGILRLYIVFIPSREKKKKKNYKKKNLKKTKKIYY